MLFLVYRTELLPDPARTAEVWREEARRAGIGDLYLARVEGFTSGVDPRSLGFDAAVEFAPDWRKLGDPLFRSNLYRQLIRLGLLSDVYLKQNINRYEGLVARMLAKAPVEYTQFRCVSPGFDNSARRAEQAAIIVDNTPEKYETWLREIMSRTLQQRDGDERIVFINAWNEWAEGNHLEPDQKNGLGYLEATRRALATQSDSVIAPAKDDTPAPSPQSFTKRLYWQLHRKLNGLRELLRHITFRRGC